MAGERLFLDTAFIQAMLNRRDPLHFRARAHLALLRAAREVWVTEAVLIEVANALSTLDRDGAARFIAQCYGTSNTRVVAVTGELFHRALDLYRERADKEWGLTDCISFVVMHEQGLTDALTTDHHFVQAGFRALLQE